MRRRDQAFIVFVLFIATQLLDGVLTYLGVTRLGYEVEMNAWLVTLMHAFGEIPALVSAKVLACICGGILYVTAYHRPLAIATGLYIGVAIVPWMFIVATTA
jgi:hypothetical protein